MRLLKYLILWLYISGIVYWVGTALQVGNNGLAISVAITSIVFIIILDYTLDKYLLGINYDDDEPTDIK